MRILVDGDACPNKTEIAALAKSITFLCLFILIMLMN